VLLLGLWAAARLYPFVPALDLGKYWHAVRPVLANPLPADGGEVFRLCLSWLLVALLIEAAAGAARTARLFLMLAGGVFAARVLIAGTVLSAGDIDGAAVALGLWLLFFRRAPGRHAILAAFFAAMIVAVRPLAPHAAPSVASLSVAALWRAATLPAVLAAGFDYGGLIWLMSRAGLRPLFAGLAGAALYLALLLA